jgi:cell division protease FtsH
LILDELPSSLSPFKAVAAAYPTEIAGCRDALVRGLPALVACDKQLVPFFYKCLRDWLKSDGLSCTYLDGRPRPDDPPGLGMMGRLLLHLSNAVRGAVQERIIVLPHLDLLMVSSGGGLSSEGREVVALLYENPQILWLGFHDLTLPLPKVIENLFPWRTQILGVPRDRLGALITRSEARKFGKELSVFQLYKYVSGVNAVQLRRVLSSIDGEDFPTDPGPAWAQLRQATLTGDLEVPEIQLYDDIGGYGPVKDRLTSEVIDLVKRHQSATDKAHVDRIESLVPHGMIFWGPPGTGKTLFAKAMANALGAAVIVVSGPELKSKWVGQSEANLRRVFVQARQSAPCVIVFDELDSFASARGTYTSSGVEHSMVNQLLTEMDGFRSNEMVFIVGTTNFVESLDPALMRPGRFELHLGIPYPNAEDRREILRIYDAKLELSLTDDALEYAVQRTSDPVEGTGHPYSGDHLYAMCRALARERMRHANTGPSTPADVETALTAHIQRPKLTLAEQRIVATHEAGHAICALHCKHVPPLQRISIQGDLGGALGFVRLADPVNRHVTTRNQLLDAICVMFGGRAAEEVLLDDVSAGAASDLHRATEMARETLEVLGLGALPAQAYRVGEVAEVTRVQIDEAVGTLLASAHQRASEIVDSHRSEVEALRDLLIERQVLDRAALTALQETSTDG